MANIIEFNEFSSSVPGGHGDLYCWLCQKGTSSRALFCHHCGTIQPVREIDHFARLGLERRIDVALDMLERHYDALKRTLDPSRFTIRGIGERGHAARQMEALDEAYATLRDPLRRGRYWLALHTDAPETATPVPAMIVDLSGELAAAADPAHCDRVAQKAGQAMQDGILGLMQALRGQNWQQANTLLANLDNLESLMANIRSRRALLTPGRTSADEIMSVK